MEGVGTSQSSNKKHRILLKAWVQNLNTVTSTKAGHIAIPNMNREKELFPIGGGGRSELIVV